MRVRPLASAPDDREKQNGGESKNSHFEHAAQLARMADVFRGRRQDELNGVRDDYDF